MSNDSNGGSSFSWFLAGLGLGSLIGVLYAPKAGQDTRDELLANALGSSEYLRQRSRDAANVAGDYVERGKGQVNDYVSRSKDQVNQYTAASKDSLNQVVAKSKEAVETGRQKINEVYSQGVNAVAEQKEKLAASYAAGKQAYEETSAPHTNEELIPKSDSVS